MMGNPDIEIIEVYNKLLSEYKKGNLKNPEPKWHLEESDIDFSLQLNQFRDELLEDGFTIIPNVDIETLLKKMTSQDYKMFRTKKLFGSTFSDLGLSEIIYLWQNGEKLIPPTIVILDNTFMLKVQNPFPKTTIEFMALDGKHRLKVSCYFNVEKIPIIAFNWQAEKIKKMLEESSR